MVVQGELEHRTPKARYSRTDRKQFVKQMAQIERRQARIRRIHSRHFPEMKAQTVRSNIMPDVHHHVGTSEACWENVRLFVQKHSGDPAVKVFHVPPDVNFSTHSL